MSTIQDDDVVIEDDIEHDSIDIADTEDDIERGPSLRDRASGAWASYRAQTRGKQIAIGAGFALASMLVLGQCGGGDSTTPADEDAVPELTAATDPLAPYPTMNPAVMAAIRPAQRADFAGAIASLTADGTSVCDVFYGVKVIPATDDQPVKLVWSLATPRSQASEINLRTGEHEGFELPSSQYPMRVFYGRPCDVAGGDVKLTAERVAELRLADPDDLIVGASTTTSTAATSTSTTTAPVVTEPPSPVTGEATN